MIWQEKKFVYNVLYVFKDNKYHFKISLLDADILKYVKIQHFARQLLKS